MRALADGESGRCFSRSERGDRGSLLMSVEDLGLSMAGKPAAAAAAVPRAAPVTPTPTEGSPSLSASTPAAAAVASSSFRVLTLHLDDVAGDVLLFCEEGITLFVPLAEICPPPTAVSSFSSGTPLAPAVGPSGELPFSAPAVAACLRMESLSQTPLSTTGRPVIPSASGCMGAYEEPRCLPRRLPQSPQQLRCSSSAIVAVPHPLPVTLFSSPSAFTEAAAPSIITTVYIMECPVLPDGVDDIDASEVPLAHPLAKITCAPHTLRFGDAWYPLHLFLWYEAPCGGVMGGAARMPSAGPCQEREVSAVTGAPLLFSDAPVGAADVRKRCLDYHMVIVSSISVDLVRIRRFLPGQCTSPEERERAEAERRSRSAQLERDDEWPSAMYCRGQDASCPSDETPSVSVTVLQRYVTRTDVCTYDARSHVLLCVNYARPCVLKPLEVFAYRSLSTVDKEFDENPAMVEETAMSAAASPSLLESVALRTWPELTLPEKMSLPLHFDSATSSRGVRRSADVTATSASSCVPFGLLTVYGQTCIYYISSTSTCPQGGARESAVSLYLFVPHKGWCPPRLQTLAAAPERRASFPPKSYSDAFGGDDSDVSMLRRLVGAASAVTASSAPPSEMIEGSFVPLAVLSLADLLMEGEQSCGAPDRGEAPTDVGVRPSRAYLLSPPPTPPSSLSRSMRTRSLSIQVIEDLIIVCTRDGKCTAVYDIADRDNDASTGVVRDRGARQRGGEQVVAAPAPVLTTRRRLLLSTVSAASRSWLRRCCSPSAPDSQDTHRLSDPSPRKQEDQHVRVTAGHLSGDSRLQQSSQSPLTGSGPDTSASAPQVVRHESDAATLVQPGTLSAGIRSTLCALATSVWQQTAGGASSSASCATEASPRFAAPVLWPVYCGPLFDDRGTQSAAASSSSRVDGGELNVRDGGARARSGAEKRRLSSRLPLLLGDATGDIWGCHLDPVRMAEWRGRTVGGCCERQRGVRWNTELRGRCGETEGHGAHGHDDVDELQSSTTAAVHSYLSFVSRRQHLSESASTGKTAERKVRVHTLVRLLGTLTAELVLGTQAAGLCSGGSWEDVEATRDILERLRPPPAAPSAHTTRMCSIEWLYEMWSHVLQNLVVEGEFVACCRALERARQLRSVAALWQRATGSLERSSSEAGDAAGEGGRHDPPWNTSVVQLQHQLLEHVFSPVWAYMRGSAPALPSSTEGKASKHVAGSRSLAQRRKVWRQQRNRLQRLLCNYVLLLRSATVEVEEPLLHLALDVVLSDVGSDTGDREPTRTAGRAHAVFELQRQGVLQPLPGTGRVLLGYCRRRSLETQEAVAAAETEGSTAASGNKVQPQASQPRSHDRMSEAVFQEAVRLLEEGGCLLEVAEAHAWRVDFPSAAAALLRVSRQCSPAPALGGAISVAGLPQRSRLLSWRGVALDVLDGAYRVLHDMEEALRVPTEVKAEGTAADPLLLGVSPAVTTNACSVRTLRRRAQAARGVYLSVAAALLPLSRLPEGAADAGISPSSPVQLRLDALRHTPPLANISVHFDAHEVRYAEVRRQAEQDLYTLRV